MATRLSRWFRKETKGFKLIFLGCAALLAYVLWVAALVTASIFIHPSVMYALPPTSSFALYSVIAQAFLNLILLLVSKQWRFGLWLWGIFAVLLGLIAATSHASTMEHLLAPPTEEMLFRCMPIALSIKKWGCSWKVFGVAAISSLFFGVMHSDGPLLLFSGFGALMSVVFLKSGGFTKNYKKATLMSIAVHGTWNLSVFLMLI